MPYSFKGSISFGLVFIPVVLQTTIKNNDISFNLLERNTKSRIKYKKTCVACDGKEVPPEDIVKGYEYEKGRYVIFEEEDFEKIKTQKDKNITIESFVNLNEIDPIYYDKPYYVVPTGAEKAFKVLLDAMEKEQKVAIAKTVLGTKETLVAIRAKDGQMLLNTMFFSEEVVANPVKNLTVEYTDKELALAETIIQSMSEEFKPEKYRDEYRERVLAAVKEKVDGNEISHPKENASGKITDLMEALQLSLKSVKKPKTTIAKEPTKTKARNGK